MTDTTARELLRRWMRALTRDEVLSLQHDTARFLAAPESTPAPKIEGR